MELQVHHSSKRPCNPLSRPKNSVTTADMLELTDLRKKYDFIPVTEDDYSELLDHCCKHFPLLETHARALGLTSPECRQIYEWTISKGLYYPYSIKVVDKTTERIVGMRVMSIGHREQALDWEPFQLDESLFSERTLKMATILEQCKDSFWKLADPEVNKVLRREISYVLPEHQRRGVALCMMEKYLDFEGLREEGIQGIVSEATSIGNQILLIRNGYRCIYEMNDHDFVDKLDDGTRGVKVLMKDIRLHEDT